MGQRTFAIGVGMAKFETRQSRDSDYLDMGREAGRKASADAGIDFGEVEQAFVGYCNEPSTAGQRAVCELGLSGIPIVNCQQQLLHGMERAVPGPQAVKGVVADVPWPWASRGNRGQPPVPVPIGLCGYGKAGTLIDEGAVNHRGRWVVNPAGGLTSKGQPLGATGLAQCSELTWELCGEADNRQVEGAKVAIQHDLGVGGAAVATLYRKEA